MGKAKRKRKNKMAKKKAKLYIKFMVEELTRGVQEAVNEWWIKEQEIMEREFICGTGENKPKGFLQGSKDWYNETLEERRRQHISQP